MHSTDYVGPTNSEFKLRNYKKIVCHFRVNAKPFRKHLGIRCGAILTRSEQECVILRALCYHFINIIIINFLPTSARNLKIPKLTQSVLEGRKKVTLCACLFYYIIIYLLSLLRDVKCREVVNVANHQVKLLSFPSAILNVVQNVKIPRQFSSAVKIMTVTMMYCAPRRKEKDTLTIPP